MRLSSFFWATTFFIHFSLPCFGQMERGLHHGKVVYLYALIENQQQKYPEHYWHARFLIPTDSLNCFNPEFRNSLLNIRDIESRLKDMGSKKIFYPPPEIDKNLCIEFILMELGDDSISNLVELFEGGSNFDLIEKKSQSYPFSYVADEDGNSYRYRIFRVVCDFFECTPFYIGVYPDRMAYIYSVNKIEPPKESDIVYFRCLFYN